jgi:hypothetical protein
VPAKDRLRRDEKRRPPLPGDQLRQRGDEGPVRPPEAGTGDLAAQYGELVAQHEDFGVLGDGVHPVDPAQLQDVSDEAVEEAERHWAGASSSASSLVKLLRSNKWTLQELTMTRLDELDAHFAELGPVPGTGPPTIGRSRCGSDSGDVFQPATRRSWRTRPNENWIAAAALVDALRARGWNQAGGRDRFGNYELTLDRGEWAARAVVTPLEYDQLYLSAQVVGASPCHGVAR